MSPTLQDKPPSKPRSRKPAPRSKKREQAPVPKLSRTDPEPIRDVMAAAGPDDVGANDEILLAATVVSAMNEAPLQQETESACDAAAVVVEAAPMPEATAAFGETFEAQAPRPDH